MAKWMPTQIDFPMLDAATSIQRYANRSGGASFGLRGLARAIILPFTLNWQGKADQAELSESVGSARESIRR
jgi:hypothetical protein